MLESFLRPRITYTKQDQLQDKQIKCLAKFLNLTMHQVVGTVKCYMKWTLRCYK